MAWTYELPRREAFLGLVLATTACALPPEGLAQTEEGDGPVIVFDLQRQPLPEIPFPNNIATRADPTSPTGLRINASMIGSTELESIARQRIDDLTGFSIYQSMSVRFDAPLDIEAVFQRHQDYRDDDGGDYQFRNDAVYLFDVDPNSPNFGQPVPLDFGDGNFPVLLRDPGQYWEHDPKSINDAFALETYNEDWNQNGVMDPGEDIDLDGVLDRANVHPLMDGDPNFDPRRDIVPFYEFETNTLLFRPVIPLRQRNTYAVVLTKRLVDPDGNPIRSPFQYVNHTSQTDALRPVVDALEPFELSEEDIAFAWTFTTQDATSDMVRVRDGIYGAGELGWLDEDNPPALSLFPMLNEIDPMTGQPPPNRYTLEGSRLGPVIGPFAALAFGDLGGGTTDQIVENHRYYAYHVSGTFRAPRLLDLADGNLDERAWPADLTAPSLRDRIEYDEIPFWCAIPRPEFRLDPTRPAPVVLYAHGYGSNKIEQLGLALHAKFGIAGCSIDAVGHGLTLEPDVEALLISILEPLGMGPAAQAFLSGRAIDVDFDGMNDPGAEVFTGYLFRTRDSLRQTLLDWMTFVRLLRAFGTQQMIDVNGDGVPEVLGDFDADGNVDLGGPGADFFASGTSLGGVLSSMLAGIEPQVIAAAPIAGGGGLVDLTTRSSQGGVREAVALRLFGPMLLGEPAADGSTRIYTLTVRGNQEIRRDIAFSNDVAPGDVVMVTNLDNDEVRCARVQPDAPPPGYENYFGYDEDNCDGDNCRADCEDGSYACDLARTFRLGVPSDAGDRWRIDILTGADPVLVSGDERDCEIQTGAELKATITDFAVPFDYLGRSFGPGQPIVALEDGYGFQRATPQLRRFTTLAQMVLDGADPVVYATHYSRDPLEFREGTDVFVSQATNVLNVTTAGDPNVPPNAGLAIARAAGFIELFRPDANYGKTINRVLIDEGVTLGIPAIETRGPQWGPVLVDVDNLSDSANEAPGSLDGSFDGLVAPRLRPPLRIIVPTLSADIGLSGQVIPLINEFDGAHGFAPPGLTTSPFDMGQFMEHQIGWFFRTRGQEVLYDPCMADLDRCSFIPAPPAP